MVVPSDFDAEEEPGSRHRRIWDYSDRPYGGCGCWYLVAILLVIALVLSLFIDAIRPF